MNRKVRRKGNASAENTATESDSTQKKKAVVRKIRGEKTLTEEGTAKSKSRIASFFNKFTATKNKTEEETQKTAKVGPKKGNTSSENKEKHANKNGGATATALRAVPSCEKMSPSANAEKNSASKDNQQRSRRKQKSKKSAKVPKPKPKEDSTSQVDRRIRHRRTKEGGKSAEEVIPPAANPAPLSINVELLEKGAAAFLETLSAKNLGDQFDKGWLAIENVEYPKDGYEAFINNMDKNQMEEIECLDENRIRLERQNPGASDYIHASLIELKNLPRKFILAQLPLITPMCVEDFWSMIYQQNVHNLYLICQTEDSTKPTAEKFAEYFPLSLGSHEYYGQIWLHNRKVEKANEAEKRPNDTYVIEILPEGCAEAVMVTVNVCSHWPEPGLPAFSDRQVITTTALGVFGAADSYEQDPVAIISKCGAGRAGTFLAITACIHELKLGKCPNIAEIGVSIRKQRPGAIDTEAQFVFIYIAVLSFAMLHITNEELKAKVEGMIQEMENILKEDAKQSNHSDSESSR